MDKRPNNIPARLLRTLIRNPKLPFIVAQRRLFPKDREAARIANWAFGDLPRTPLNSIFPGMEDIDIHVVRVCDRQVGTSVDVQEIVAISAIVKLTRAKSILEIGTYDGNTALNLAANTPLNAVIITVDLPTNWDGKFAVDVPQQLINVSDRNNVGRQFKGTPFEAKIRQVFADSMTMDWTSLPVPFDMVFIDGCHYYSYVKRDTENALQNLRSGGIVVWHDYGEYKDVSRVVDETSGLIEVRAIRGTRLAVGFKK